MKSYNLRHLKFGRESSHKPISDLAARFLQFAYDEVGCSSGTCEIRASAKELAPDSRWRCQSRMKCSSARKNLN